MPVKGGKTPGHIKAGGRQKGTPNKKTLELLEVWESLGYDPAYALHHELPLLEPEQRAQIHLKLMAYKYPQRKAIEHSGPNGLAIDVNMSEKTPIMQKIEQIMGGPENASKPK